MTARTGRDRQPRAPMSAARAVAVLEHLRRRGIPAWLEGGWGIDALLRRQTREHDDLDVILDLEQADEAESALLELGYATKRGAAPLSFELVDDEGHQVDVHPVSFLPNGDALYRMDDGRDWTYPAGSFVEAGRIAGRCVGCLTPELALVCHSQGYALDDEHQRDVHAVCDQFGLAFPAIRTA